jgi:hypothetical protein
MTAQQTSWLTEQRKHEINRLESILRNAEATAEEKRIAADMLRQYRESN